MLAFGLFSGKEAKNNKSENKNLYDLKKHNTPSVISGTILLPSYS
jgi:hypothetical protein